MIDLVLAGLATWYVSYSLTSTHGPGGVFDWVRELGGGRWHGRHGETLVELKSAAGSTPPQMLPSTNGLLDCPVCLSFWSALILLLVPMGIVVQALALAGAAMLAHGLAGWRFGGG